MAPARRPLPDLCLIAVFKQLKPNEQIKAAQMSPRAEALVRAANRRLRSLVITTWENYKGVGKNVDAFSLAAKPSMKLLGEDDVVHPQVHPCFVDFPVTTLSDWRCLLLNPFDPFSSLPSTDLVVRLFPSVTRLTVISLSLRHSQYTADLLEHPRWAEQLTSLMLVDYEWMVGGVVRRLAGAINGLSALEHLALHWQVSRAEDVPDLGRALAHLQVLALYLNWSIVMPFLLSLEPYAAVGNGLRFQVHLVKYIFSDSSLLALSEPLRRRLVRYGTYSIHYCDNWALLGRQLPALTSISGVSLKPSQAGRQLSALSTLPQLVHLGLEVNFLVFKEPLESSEMLVVMQQKPQQQQQQLSSLRALDLELIITSHSQLQWLSGLQRAMPRLQTVHLKRFTCECCNACLSNYLTGSLGGPKYSVTLELLRSLLIHLGVSPRKVIIQFGSRQSEYHLADEIFDN